MDRLLRGEIPPGGGCDLKTLAQQAGIPRTGFYAKGDRLGPYQHLAEEFERRLSSLRQAGQITDPRDAQIARLKTDNARLRERLADQETAIAELESFKTRAIPRLAAQHAETERLRQHRPANVRELRPSGETPIIGSPLRRPPDDPSEPPATTPGHASAASCHGSNSRTFGLPKPR